ncbi:MAG: thiamine-monophosphate kinase [Myxococcota bacterium]|jgi:thiamine-monophosphate kinase
MTVADLGEGGLVEYATAAFAPAHPLPLGIGDDAAVVDTSERTVACADAMVEGVHFDLGYWAAEDVGYKLVASNVSDIAAMGATPSHALFTFSLPSSTPRRVATDMIDGVARAAVEYDLVVVGGDVTGSPGPIMLSLSLMGRPGPNLLRRDAARPGHSVYVTGFLGLAGLAYQELAAGRVPSDAASGRFFRPTPRLDEGQRLAHGRPACMDLSDGLWVDAARLARASGVELVIDLDRIPRHHDLPDDVAMKLMLTGGEDYELLFTMEGASPVPATRIGVVRAGAGSVVWREYGKPVSFENPTGFKHL